MNARGYIILVLIGILLFYFLGGFNSLQGYLISEPASNLSEVNSSQIKLPSFQFYDSKTGCNLTGTVSVDGVEIGDSQNGTFTVDEDKANLLTNGKTISIEGVSDECFGKDKGLSFYSESGMPSLTYSKFDKPILLGLTFNLRYPSRIKEMQGFIRPEEVNSYLQDIHVHDNKSLDRVEYILDYLAAKFVYTPDVTRYKESEYWATPVQSLRESGGDCEDWATTALSLIKADNSSDQCYNILFPSHVSLFCYLDGVYAFYDQDGVHSKTILLRNSVQEDKIRLREMRNTYFQIYGLSPGDNSISAVFDNKVIHSFSGDEEFIEWAYGLSAN